LNIFWEFLHDFGGDLGVSSEMSGLLKRGIVGMGLIHKMAPQ